MLEPALSQENEGQSQEYRDSVIVDWIQDLYTSDFFVEEDSTRYLLEKEKLLNDTTYRQLVYPESYSWPAVVQLIEQQELKKAFWYLINLYRDDEANKQKVLTCLLTYGKLFKMDEVVFNTFFTYCETDPQISKIKDNEATIFAPHILEEKEDAMMDILTNMKQYQNAHGLIEHDPNDGREQGEGSDHQLDH